MNRPRISAKMRRQVFEDAGYRCAYCGGDADQIDHIFPWSFEFTHREENLVACCGTCNQIASNRHFDSFIAKRDYILQRREKKGLAPTPLAFAKIGREQQKSAEGIKTPKIPKKSVKRRVEASRGHETPPGRPDRVKRTTPDGPPLTVSSAINLLLDHIEDIGEVYAMDRLADMLASHVDAIEIAADENIATESLSERILALFDNMIVDGKGGFWLVCTPVENDDEYELISAIPASDRRDILLSAAKKG